MNKEKEEVLTSHQPVLVKEVLEWLVFSNCSHQDQSKLILDCTLGGGGHSEAMLDADKNVKIIGMDQDPKSLNRASHRLAGFGCRFEAVLGNFSDLPSLLSDKAGCRIFDGILVDLGISSDQLDDPERGFAYSKAGPLDMRMNTQKGVTAADLLNQSTASELVRIFKVGGVGAYCKDLVSEILKRRPIENTLELASICKEVGLRSLRTKKNRSTKYGVEVESIGYWATVPFQALRIAVNDEFGAIRKFLDHVLDYLSPRGRLAIISFHSLEDQLVAKKMREWARDEQMPVRLPTRIEYTNKGSLLTKSAVFPSADEVVVNPRGRSARMRVFEKSEYLN